MAQGLLASDASLQQLHDAALQILDEIGIRLEHAEMRARLAGRGCRVDGERVYIPPALVAETLAAIPPAFTIYGRSTEPSVTLGSGRTFCTSTGIFPTIYDFESGELRRSTLDDVRLTTRLLDALPYVHVVYVSLVDATELAPHMVTVSDFAATLAHTTKPLLGPGVANRAEAETVVALAQAVRGGAAALREHPLCIPFVCSVSPLYFPEKIVDAVEVVAEAGLPLDALSNPVMGLTAPYTLAGTVALGHAEVLAMAVMAHTVTPGLPILAQNTPSVADMRSLASTTGGPETGLIRQTAVALDQSVGIPACAHGHTSSARLDYQSADEKALNTLAIASARPALLGGLGALANVTATAYETLVLDNERYGAILRILEGVQTDADHLGLEVVAALSRGESALTHDHTLRYLRSAEVWRPRLALRQGLVGGAPPSETSLDRARAEVRRLLASHTVEALPEDVTAQMEEILREYDRACGGREA